MNIIEKIKQKQSNLLENKAITIAFIGDSVTQGCFECYLTSETSLETVFDYKSAYSTRLKELLNLLYPNVQFNIINAGISGDGATTGYERLERDVLAYSPDLCVVSFGLNDSCLSTIEQYSTALSGIFSALQEKNIETIFLAFCLFLHQHMYVLSTKTRLLPNYIQGRITFQMLPTASLLRAQLNQFDYEHVSIQRQSYQFHPTNLEKRPYSY